MIDLTKPIYSRPDGTFVATVSGYPYHVTKETPEAWEELRAHLLSHPESIEVEAPLPEPTKDELDASARMQRNALLAASDWTQVGDTPDKVDKTAWRVYRQALRDITEQDGWPFNIQWPKEPGK